MVQNKEFPLLNKSDKQPTLSMPFLKASLIPSTRGTSGPGTTKSIFCSTAQATISLKFDSEEMETLIRWAFEASKGAPFPKKDGKLDCGIMEKSI